MGVNVPVQLLLDTRVDANVNFTALEVLEVHAVSQVAGGDAGVNGNRIGAEDAKVSSSGVLPVASAAGSRDWLPRLVAAGREEAIVREKEKTKTSLTGGNGNGNGDGSDAFFVVDVEVVLNKYRRWHHCFPRVKPFYAVKCNPDRAVVRALAMTSGCGFDCASPAEIDQVLECGVDPSRIIYANPCKDMVALEHALSVGITTMTFDSSDELHKIRRLLDTRAKVPALKEAEVQVVLRLRVPDAHSDNPLGEKYGAVETDCNDLIALAVSLRLALVGISFHSGSGCNDAQAFSAALRMARVAFDLAERQGVNLTLLDIGGGFPGWDGSEFIYEATSDATAVVAEESFPTSPPDTAAKQHLGVGDDGENITTPTPPLSLSDIAEVTLPVLDDLFPPGSGVQVIAEPGRYFVEASHILFTRIYAKRQVSLRGLTAGGINGKSTAGDGRSDEQRRLTGYFIDEGVDGCFKDRLLCGVNFEPCPVSLGRVPDELLSPRVGMPEEGRSMPTMDAIPSSNQTVEDGDEEEDAVLMGPSGLAVDVVARKRLPKSLRAGDWLYFSRMGAYTSSIATVSASAALENSHCYVASTPAGAVEGGTLHRDPCGT